MGRAVDGDNGGAEGVGSQKSELESVSSDSDSQRLFKGVILVVTRFG